MGVGGPCPGGGVAGGHEDSWRLCGRHFVLLPFQVLINLQSRAVRNSWYGSAASQRATNRDFRPRLVALDLPPFLDLEAHDTRSGVDYSNAGRSSETFVPYGKNRAKNWHLLTETGILDSLFRFCGTRWGSTVVHRSPPLTVACCSPPPISLDKERGSTRAVKRGCPRGHEGDPEASPCVGRSALT